MGRSTHSLALIFALAGCADGAHGQGAIDPARVHSAPVGLGWARSSVNAVIFRTSSIVTHDTLQYTAYYDDSARVVLARRTRGSDRWELNITKFTNDVKDAHNAIAIAVDGGGVLHVAWAEHGRALHYARAVRAGSLELGASESMTGRHEARVTYPQFQLLGNGDLLFLYRDGESGNGKVMLNRWKLRASAWTPVAHPLISGEGARNAYLNPIAVDSRGGWHLSWTWRETFDVATNHDILYAFSPDEGRSWRSSFGREYTLPITARSAELAWVVPQGQELINQTSMAIDASGRPVIATYWRSAESEVPQFRLVWRDATRWRVSQIGERTLPFRLSGGGTKRIPVSRPLILAGADGAVHMIFRDEERGEGISVATSIDVGRSKWTVRTLSSATVGQWEPTHDPIAWKRFGRLSLFVQRVGQGDGETLENVPAQIVSVLDWKP